MDFSFHIQLVILRCEMKLCLVHYRDADETIAWIMEKDAILSTDDYGRDLASVQALRRKHEGVERDLAALNEKVTILNLKIINFIKNFY
jgi:hypothetical protein